MGQLLAPPGWVYVPIEEFQRVLELETEADIPAVLQELHNGCPELGPLGYPPSFSEQRGLLTMAQELGLLLK